MSTLFDPAPAFNGEAEGERRRDAALSRLRVHRAPLIRKFQRAFLRHLLAAGPDTTDAVRGTVPVPSGVDPRFVGSAVRALAEATLITPTGERRKIPRPEAHARRNDVWSIRDRATVEFWLLANPELPDDPTLPADPHDFVI